MSAVSLNKISRLVGYPKFLAAALPRLPKPLAKRLRRFHFAREIRRAAHAATPPVLVYTAPKVASTAVTAALAAAGQNVYQVHLLSAANLRSLREQMRKRGLAPRNVHGVEDLAYAINAELIRPRLPAKIVSLVRDPVARNISFYFEVLDELWNTEGAHERVGVERLLAEFHERFGHDRGVEWFDLELKPVLGIDVYEQPFPRDRGFQRIDSGPYEVLIMRHDLEDRLKERCLAELVGVPSVSLAPKNVSVGKPYADVYREFLARVELPEDYVDRLLGSKYARHFFGAEERARLRAEWLGARAARSAEYV